MSKTNKNVNERKECIDRKDIWTYHKYMRSLLDILI